VCACLCLPKKGMKLLDVVVVIDIVDGNQANYE